MPTTIYTFPPGNYTGTITIPITDVAAGFNTLSCLIECSQWTDESSSLEATFQVSLDGGNTWLPAGGFGGGGGLRSADKSGGVYMSGATNAPPEACQIQGEIIITGTLVTQGVTMEAQ